jgi:hypothetical protein
MALNATSDSAHHAAYAAAIDKCDAGPGYGFAQRFTGIDISWTVARRGTAVDANGTNRIHATNWATEP